MNREAIIDKIRQAKSIYVKFQATTDGYDLFKIVKADARIIVGRQPPDSEFCASWIEEFKILRIG